MKNALFLIASLAVLPACTTNPPKNTENLCQIFREKNGWYEASLNSARRWGVPIAVQMAIINQESAFVADAAPPTPAVLGLVPWMSSSSAYGYPQAKDETWADYQEKSGNRGADREDFADSCDFVAWYCAVSRDKLGISPIDVSNLYLAYHEGHGGFKRQSYLPKQWLMNTAQKVHQRALRYDAQLSSCRQDLN